MKINDILTVHGEYSLYESKGMVKTVMNKLKGMTWDKSSSFLGSEFKDFVKLIKDQGIEKDVLKVINKHMDTNISNLNSFGTKKITEQIMINEGMGDWWKEASGNLYGALSFYPILTMFLELDKVIKGSDQANIKAVIIYGLMWIAIITGKVVSGKLTSKKVKDVPATHAEAV